MMSEQITNLLLVAEVEKRPILYNYNLPGYSKKQETEQAWAEVGEVVKLTAADCKARWKNIRTVFVRHMKPHRKGAGYKAYYLSDALQFTIPFIKALGKLPSEEEEGTVLWDGGNVDNELIVENQNTLPSPSPPPNSKLSLYSSPLIPSLPQYQDRHSEPMKQHTHNKKKRPAKYDDVNKTVMEYLDQKYGSSSAKCEQSAAEPREEALKMFLLSFLPDLMEMDDGEVRQFKRKTLDAVDEIMSPRSKSARPPPSS